MDEESNATIEVIIENSESNANETVLTVAAPANNRWHEIREDIHLRDANPTVIFHFIHLSTKWIFVLRSILSSDEHQYQIRCPFISPSMK